MSRGGEAGKTKCKVAAGGNGECGQLSWRHWDKVARLISPTNCRANAEDHTIFSCRVWPPELIWTPRRKGARWPTSSLHCLVLSFYEKKRSMFRWRPLTEPSEENGAKESVVRTLWRHNPLSHHRGDSNAIWSLFRLAEVLEKVSFAQADKNAANSLSFHYSAVCTYSVEWGSSGSSKQSGQRAETYLNAPCLSLYEID